MERRVQNLVWVMIGLIAVVAAVAIVASLLFGQNNSNGMYNYPYGMVGGYGYTMWIMPVIGMISLVFVISFIYYINDVAGGHRIYDDSNSRMRYENIIMERLARGEITKDEYSKLMSTLQGKVGP